MNRQSLVGRVSARNLEKRPKGESVDRSMTATTSTKNRLRFNAISGWLGRKTALIALLIVFTYGALALPSFLTRLNLSAIAFQYSIIGFLAIGQLLVILTEGIDLSQGSLVALTSVVLAVLARNYGLAVGITGAILITTSMGLVNGLLVSRTRIPAFVATLGMLGIARGLALLISNTKPIAVGGEAFSNFGRAKILEIPFSLIFWLAVSGLIYVFLARRRTGRYIYAVGGSEESARLSGVKTKRVKMLVYVISAFLTAIGGILWSARLGSGSPIGGTNYELESIAAVVVGGGSLFGGIGTVGGTVAGTLLFGTINSILNLEGISPYLQGTLKGALILLAVALSQIRRTRSA
jgi:ribose transport system permease protein